MRSKTLPALLLCLTCSGITQADNWAVADRGNVLAEAMLRMMAAFGLVDIDRWRTQVPYLSPYGLGTGYPNLGPGQYRGDTIAPSRLDSALRRNPLEQYTVQLLQGSWGAAGGELLQVRGLLYRLHLPNGDHQDGYLESHGPLLSFRDAQYGTVSVYRFRVNRNQLQLRGLDEYVLSFHRIPGWRY